MPTSAEKAALAAATKMLAGDVEGEATPSGEEEVVEPVVEELTVTSHGEEEPPDLEDEDDNFLAELDAPDDNDFLAQAEAEVDLEHDDFSEISDGERAALKRALAAEKKAAYYEGLRLKADRKNWRTEAEKFFPYASVFLDEQRFEDATSRRAYLKQAKTLHGQLKPQVEKVLETAREEVAAERERIREEERVAAKKAWGSPTVEVPGGVPSESGAIQERVERYREKRDLVGAIRAMITKETE